jgi:putative ABC transport system permease protein
MIKNYLLTALRTLTRSKLYTTLNVVGLTFGMSCFILIGLYLFDELTYDTQHSNAARIYRVIEHKNVKGEQVTIAAASYKLAEESKKTIPGVESTTRIQRIGRANILTPENPTNFFQETVTVADEHFTQIFDFVFVAGDRKTALAAPNSVIITEGLAMKLFNKTNVLGKVIKFNFIPSPFKITGVLKDQPRNSSFNFNSIMSEASFLAMDEGYKKSVANDWLSENYSVYTLLKPNTDANTVAAKMAKMIHDNFTTPAGTTFSFSLQPLKDVHLHSENIVDGARNSNVDAIAEGNIAYVRIFSFIAFFVLLIAGINYMNLTTARASSRLKEIGVRKTIGALQNNIIRQFLLESLLVSLFSFLLSLGVVNLVLPVFNQFCNKQLSLNFSTNYRIWLYAIVFAVLTGLFSGSYPALMLSRFKPVLLLKGLKLKQKSDLSLRKGLIVFQFTVSIVMIIGTLVLFLQVRYLNNADLGFNKDLLTVIDVNTRSARSNFEVVKAEMAKIPTVKSVSVTSRVPGEWKSIRTVKIKHTASADEPKICYMIGADKDFLTTFGIKLAKGRNFDTQADSSGIILNETAAAMLHVTEAEGQLVEIPALSPNGDGTFVPLNEQHIPFKPRIIGIVKDFHFQSLRSKIEPLVLCYNQNPIQPIDYYTAKIAATDIKGTLEKLKEVMVKNDIDDPFEYHFLNDQLAFFYLEDGRRETMLIWAAMATIFIACLGLFGLATYSAEQRIKEIGIRKVLGASSFNLASLLSADFLKLVLIANGIAFPIAWWTVSKWLQEYAYHIDVQWWFFVVAGVLALIIALLTVLYQAIKAAIANPVKSLRTE